MRGATIGRDGISRGRRGAIATWALANAKPVLGYLWSTISSLGVRPTMRRHLLLVSIWIGLIAAPISTGLGSAAAPSADLQALLSRKILTPDLPLTEVQAYCDAHIRSMPEIKSAAD